MSNTEKTVAKRKTTKATQTNNFVANIHATRLAKTIKDFYSFANPSEWIEANNDLLNTYLEKGLSEEEGYCHKHIQNIVYMVTFQNQFITALKENWENYQEFTNPKK